MKLKIEIIYYKILGIAICLCFSKTFKSILLKYVDNRFPVTDQE